MEGRMPRLEEYAAGSFLADAPGWLIISLISYITEYMRELLSAAEAIIVTTFLISTAISSYMICRVAYRDRMKIGLTIGLTSVMLNILFLSIFGRMPISLVIELLSVQVFGGVLGAYVVEKRAT
jgi:hypothetical protein